jgi:hypothetical protein
MVLVLRTHRGNTIDLDDIVVAGLALLPNLHYY